MNKIDTIHILLVDHHTLFRQGLVELLKNNKRFEIVGQAKDHQEALDIISRYRVDIVLMDIHMPFFSGVEAVRLLKEHGYTGRTLVLSVSDNEDDLYSSIKNGADGYLLKSIGIEELTRALYAVAAGETIISPSMATKLLGEFRLLVSGKSRLTQPESLLSLREEEVLKMVSNGLNNNDIAGELGISINTVKSHIGSIMRKLQCKNRYEIMLYALKNGFTLAK